MPFFIDPERYTCRLAEERAVDAVRVDGENQTERRVDDGHHHLELYTCAAPESGVRPRQKSHLLCRENAFTVQDLPRQLVLFEDPRISEVKKRSHGEYPPNDRNAVFHVKDGLRVATHVNDIVNGPRDCVSGFRIGHCNVSHEVRDWRDLTEIKSADVEITAQKESL